jgi:phage terminase small subunit
MTLTPKQEKFAQAVASGMTQADAYRHAYNAENMADSTIWSRASELAADGKVSGRIKALQEFAAIDALWSLEMSIKTKRQALQIGIEKGDSRAIIQASESLDKLYGFEPARKVDITSSDGSMSPNKRRPFEDLTDEELDEELARRGLKRADIGL